LPQIKGDFKIITRAFDSPFDNTPELVKDLASCLSDDNKSKAKLRDSLPPSSKQLPWPEDGHTKPCFLDSFRTKIWGVMTLKLQKKMAEVHGNRTHPHSFFVCLFIRP
jgi:hypothetical protein